MSESIFKDTIAEMTWKQLEEMGKKDMPVLFPLGVIEEHGPQLPLGTDIYMSYMLCKKIRNEVIQLGKECLIAPPYYWGINHCTGAFPGCFTMRPETMKMALYDIFTNLKQFGFSKVICVNQHGDPIHNQTIIDAIKLANCELNMQIKLVIEPYDLESYQLTGQEDYCLVDEAEYPQELFIGEDDKLDIHAGAYETAAMIHYYPELVNQELAKQLPDYSLTYETIGTWMEGGEGVKQVVPLGYAGNPADFEAHISNMSKVFDIMCHFIAEKM